jgi:hypothetical protein
MSVYKCINAVQADLAKTGIGKDSENTFDKYKFRGIDAVYNAVAPLLAKHGLCILPRMVNRSCEERQSQKGGALFYVTVEAEFDFVCAEDGTKHTVRTFGEAMDRGDKATNKAMSAAYKYAAFQTFAIPTEGDNDADPHTHEVAPKQSFRSSPTMGEFERLPTGEQDYINDLAIEIVALVASQQQDEAWRRVESEHLDDSQKTALWSRLDSKTRAAIKKAGQSMKEAA